MRYFGFRQGEWKEHSQSYAIDIQHSMKLREPLSLSFRLYAQSKNGVVRGALKDCQEFKDLLIFAYVMMTYHIHIIAQVKEDSIHNLSGVLRDFKKFTSHNCIEFMEAPGESRKEWMLDLFQNYGKKNSANNKYQIWTNDNHPIELYSPKLIWQKLDYIHQNPVRAGIVDKAEEYLYNSARTIIGKNMNHC